jgi:hypothetical protein
MPSMKHTSCKICGKNLDNYNYEYQESHTIECINKYKPQTKLLDFNKK